MLKNGTLQLCSLCKIGAFTHQTGTLDKKTPALIHFPSKGFFYSRHL
jgi:hypothetical protein